MSFQSPLSRALGHGSAGSGTNHWLSQRLTAIALIPLGLWFVLAMASLSHGNYAMVTDWVAEPLNAILLILFLIALVYHSLLGQQVIIEDYVHGALGVLLQIAVSLMHVMLAVAGIYSVIVTALGAGQ